MEDVDYPNAWLRLKAYIGQERGHGCDDLLAEMSRIEVECSEAHRDARMARKSKGESESKRNRSTSKEGPPRDRAATAAQTRAPHTADPLPQEGQGTNGNGHRDQRQAAAVGN